MFSSFYFWQFHSFLLFTVRFINDIFTGEFTLSATTLITNGVLWQIWSVYPSQPVYFFNELSSAIIELGSNAVK